MQVAHCHIIEVRGAVMPSKYKESKQSRYILVPVHLHSQPLLALAQSPGRERAVLGHT